jgi:chromosome condensin MukBEF ATPase and DNA-binding subunit MukB
MIDFDVSTVLKTGGILALAAVLISGVILLFSRRYADKDRAFTETIQRLTINFMEFIERKYVKSNATNQEYIAAIRQMQQEIAKKGEVMKELASQLHEQNTMLKSQNEKLHLQYERITNSEITIMEIKTQLHEIYFFIKNELLKK